MKPKKTIRLASILLLIITGALGGCVNGRSVQVLKSPPSVPYESLGAVSYFQQDEVGFQDQVLNEDPVQGLREKAAALGADAVILTGRKSIHPTNDQGAVVGSRSGEFVTGMAIRLGKPGPGEDSPSSARPSP